MDESEDLNEFEFALRDGIPSALRYLNARTPHRFTAIFAYSDDRLQNLYLIDRENAKAAPWAEFGVADSYCSIVRDSGEPFVIGDSTVDPRFADHPARGKVISYCGVPLWRDAGALLGSLCHFDYRPILLSGLDLGFLRRIAPAIAAAVINAAQSSA